MQSYEPLRLILKMNGSGMSLWEEGSLKDQYTAGLLWVPLLKWLWKHSLGTPDDCDGQRSPSTFHRTGSLDYMETVVVLSHWDLGTATAESPVLAYLCVANGVLYPVSLYNILWYLCVLFWILLVATNMKFLNIQRRLWHETQIY